MAQSTRSVTEEVTADASLGSDASASLCHGASGTTATDIAAALEMLASTLSLAAMRLSAMSISTCDVWSSPKVIMLVLAL